MVRKLRTPLILGYPNVGTHLVVRMLNDVFGASGVCADFSQEVVCRGLGWPEKCEGIHVMHGGQCHARCCSVVGSNGYQAWSA